MVEIEKQYIEKVNWESLKGYSGAEFDNDKYDWHSAIHIVRYIIGRLDLAAIRIQFMIVMNKFYIKN